MDNQHFQWENLSKEVLFLASKWKTWSFSFSLLASLLISPRFGVAAGQPGTVRHLGTPDSALLEMVDTIRSARNGVDLEYYIVAPCGYATAIILNELSKKITEAKREGRPFRVRLLMDYYPFVAYHPDFRAEDFAGVFEARGIEVKIHNPTRAPHPNSNLRDHRKLMIADGKRGITGGRNIGDDYFGLSTYLNYVDRDAVVEGAPVAAMQSSFEQFWNDRASRPPQELRAVPRKEVAGDPARCLAPDSRAEEVLKKLELRRSELEQRFPRVSCDSIEFVSDRPPSYTNPRQLGAATIKEIRSAAVALRAENYVYLPDGVFAQSLNRASSRGVSTEWITNAFGTKNMESWTDIAHNARILQDATGNRRFSAVPMTGDKGMSWLGAAPDLSPYTNDIAGKVKGAYWPVHSKIFTMDGRSAIIGSYNVDPRSRNSNAEAAFFVRNCPGFVAGVNREMDLIRDFGISVKDVPEYRECVNSHQSDGKSFLEQLEQKILSEFLFGFL